METIYNKEVLTAAEQVTLDVARQSLLDGLRLYGFNKEDVSHVEYALGLALSSLTHLFEDQSLATLIEVGIDNDGFFVSFLTPGVDIE